MRLQGQRQSTNFEDMTGTPPSLTTRIGSWLLKHGVVNDATGKPYQEPWKPPTPSKKGDWPTVGTPGGDIKYDRKMGEIKTHKVSQAGLDVGLGAELQQQTMDQVVQRRKATLLAANQQPAAFGALAMGAGVSGTGNTGGMALKALMGGVNGG